MLNFACGSRIHPDWVNIDFSPIDNRVKKVNLLSTLPFKNDSFDVAYSSHFLEHLHPNKAVQILKEIKRILKPNGIVRIVVPDLQNMVQVYLDTHKKIESYMQNNMLDSSKKSMGGGYNEAYATLTSQYDWLMLEIFDQMVRIQSGGDMKICFESVIANDDKILGAFIKERVGVDIFTNNTQYIPLISKITLDKIANKFLNIYLKILYFLTPASIRNEIFIRTSIGERHKWAYDNFSLTRLLQEAGFREIEQMRYNTSAIAHFNEYYLDINSDGSPYKGVSSLYIEAINKI